MYLLNITTKVNHQVAEEWVQWQKQIRIPAMMDTGHFTSYAFNQLLHHDDEEGIIYVIQLEIATLKDYEAFMQNHSDKISSENQDRWGDNYISFHTLMKKI